MYMHLYRQSRRGPGALPGGSQDVTSSYVICHIILCHMSHHHTGNLDGALEHYKVAVKMAPSDPTFVFNLAQVC